MAHEGIFCTKAEIDTKVGELVDTTGYTEANINLACIRAEGLINAVCRFNFSAAWSGLISGTRAILAEAASSFVACQFIAYNMAGYTSRVEAEDMINLNWASFNFCIKQLQEQSVVDFVRGK